MQRRIFIAFITLLLIGVLTTGILALSLFRVQYFNDIEDKLVTNSNLISEFIYQQEDLSKDRLNELASVYSKKTDARVTLIDKNGWVVGDSHADYRELENHINRPEVQEAMNGEIGVVKRFSKSVDTDMFYVAIPFSREGSDLSAIRLSVSIKELEEINKTILKYIVISILAGLFVAFILGFRFVHTVTEPIKQLTNATKKISQGNFGEKVYFRTEDELGTLAENFNVMSQELHDTIEELQQSNTKIKATLTSMINGVLALDSSKKVMFINPTAEKIFDLKEEEIKGKHILEIIRNNVLDDLIHKLLHESVTSKEEIEVFEPEHRILNVYTNPITLTTDPNRSIGVLILIQDVTEIRKLERMRKDFVANVSHELKTPLTSIKGFIETLKNGAAEEKAVRDKFLDIIDIEANRLTALIHDLLLLSEIENKNNRFNEQEIDTNKAIVEVIQFLSGMAKQKGITIVDKINNNLPSICGNRGWFKQMLINLIDNGIKYTPDGGSITITGYSTNRELIFKIKDTGIGIDSDHINRLFERFYRVDKARSRQVGGTGLGLAIVKHIVLSLKGNISVKSEINKGTEFTIALPLKKEQTNK
ncbi:two-component system histidine kinase PnpS [Sporosalibacterium faouarense]|uniref:two-component system histidine kinase PnpS n=1 Tax=Sporosalibacterium faouarense TaxID=516123 RepID=UPI00141C1B25|nr:ATP-binding protein [Sporosalibacterium faouarense]MTI49027.1 cell wall metabolism sensor histidine kinase WalK [Bacillota bacterium]